MSSSHPRARPCRFAPDDHPGDHACVPLARRRTRAGARLATGALALMLATSTPLPVGATTTSTSMRQSPAATEEPDESGLRTAAGYIPVVGWVAAGGFALWRARHRRRAAMTTTEVAEATGAGDR